MRFSVLISNAFASIRKRDVSFIVIIIRHINKIEDGNSLDHPFTLHTLLSTF